MEASDGTRAAIQCNLEAIPATERAAHQALTRQLFEEKAREKQELPDGYAFRFDGARLADVFSFVANERLCCPFWSFAVEVSPENGPLWLRLTGPEGAKALLE